jgi:8-oxo-dGTP diphosphatase
MSDHVPRAADDAKAVAWHPVGRPPKLAFDHAKILKVAVGRLRAKVRYQPIGFELLPAKFTLGQLQRLYEIVLERPLDKRNFRKKVLGLEVLIELGETEQGVAHRAGKLYRFDEGRYREQAERGVNFEV